jgi:2-polyprenyl-3-methyl-5-hydroxy-6-metoxy-1,4-benzoquinol methylase
MRKLIKAIVYNKHFQETWLDFFVYLSNLSYQKIASLAIMENKGTHPKHRIMSYHDFFVDNIETKDNVLDIGCGNGFLAFDVAGKAKKVVGIDIEKKNIIVARKRYKKNNLNFIVGDATIIDFPEEMDVIILSNVLEHIKNRIDFLKKVKIISPKILIRVPLITRSWLAVYLKEKGREYRLDETHFIEYTEENFKLEIEKSGMKIESFYTKWGELYAVISAKNK